VFYKKNIHVINKWINKKNLKFAVIAAVQKKNIRDIDKLGNDNQEVHGWSI